MAVKTVKQEWTDVQLKAVLDAGLEPRNAEDGRGVWAAAPDGYSIHLTASGEWSVLARDGRVMQGGLALSRALAIAKANPEQREGEMAG